MTIEKALADFSTQLSDALGQHTAAIADVRSVARETKSQFTIAQLGIASLGTQLDDAEKRINRSIARLDVKLNALLRAAKLNPADFDVP